ncbi:MAG: hypothetical protein LKJ25_07825 [Clostridia bacterium]|jgi:hypothetical protein|nr:hypothetical protein [Clostridia bacterium]
MDVKRINLKDIHKTPENGMYITKTEKENIAFLFISFILTVFTVLKIKKLFAFLKR